MLAPEVTADACVEIMTGAPCPPGTEAVVMKEDVRRDGPTAMFPASIARGQNIMPRGAESSRDAVILPEGAVLTPVALGLLAAVGRSDVRVHRTPRLALLVTGDEVVADGTPPLPAEIRDSNGPMLSAMARSLGVSHLTATGVRDTRECLATALDEASGADVVVLTGGVSAGNYDLVPAALLAHGAKLVFHKVRQQPGKPILFATKGSQLFFGLPGTPLGCHLGFHRYVGAAVRALAGWPQPVDKQGRLAQAWSTTSVRQQFVFAEVVATHDGSHEVTPLRLKGSSDLFTPWNANAYMNVAEGMRTLSAGDIVRFDWLLGAR
jgi:molybdopterin molybdotransferase